MSLKLNRILKISSWVALLLTATVSIPLAIKTYQDAGGPWGFEMIGLPVLLTLSAYVFFAVAGLAKWEARRRQIFIGAHVITLTIGVVSLYVFPVYPLIFVIAPVILATLGIVDKEHYNYFLLFMIILSIAANIVLLKWELDFGRTIPLIQLFKASKDMS